MPGESRELPGIRMPDLHSLFVSSMHPQPSPIVELQAVSVCNGHRFGKIEKDFLSLVRHQTSPPPVTAFKVQGQCRGGRVLRPMADRAMDRSAR